MKMRKKISTGLPGLDEILHGGLITQKSYLIQGGPGSGKSTLGLYFLSQAVQNDEKALYITFGESEKSISINASQMGIDLSGVTFLDLSPQEDLDQNLSSYNVFSPSEIEQEPLMQKVVGAIENHAPTRIVLDSITMLRFLNQDPFHMRKMTLSLINFITGRGATLMMISESMENSLEEDATFLVDGVLELQSTSAWRRMKVSKYRGSDFESGTHAFTISQEGVNVFPRLRPNEYSRQFQQKTLSSVIEEIDDLMHGGVEKGTISLIVGATGVGKTNLGLQFLKESASRNERCTLYTFEESKELIIERSKNISLPVEDMIDAGNLKIVPVEPLSYSPDEFTQLVRNDVEQNNTQMVMIDSIGGYKLSIREENILERLHALTVYLQNMGVTTFILNETENILGQFSATNLNASYLADNILFLRYLEINGQLRRAMGVLKKRLSDFENTIREYKITSQGIEVGQPLVNMRGILSGTPEIIE